MKTQLELIGRISWSSGYKNQIWEFWRFEREDSLLGQNNKREGSVGAKSDPTEIFYFIVKVNQGCCSWHRLVRVRNM